MSKAILTDHPPKGSSAEWAQFDEISPGLAIGRLPLHWINDVQSLTREHLSPDTASETAMRAVLAHNADAFFGMFARSDGTHTLRAYFAQLPLSEEGHAALLARRIDLKNPALEFIVPTGERAAAVYMWGIVAQRKLAIFQPHLRRRLTHLVGLPHYATLATDAGRRTGLHMGFTPVPPDTGEIGDLFVIPKAATIPAHQIEVRTVATAEAFEQARAVRAAVFMQEQQCPYAEEFDGNDFSAQHVIGYVDGAPAATIRIRYFAGFAKVERFAVLKPFRKTGVKDEVIRFALDLIARKGYRDVYGHAQTRLIPFWKQRGFDRTGRSEDIRFSDHDYVEIRVKLPPHQNPISINSSAMTLNRPEGAWDVPGVLEGSQVRPVTRPAA